LQVLAMLDNLVFVIGGAGSGSLEGIGIGLSYSSSSKSIKFDDVAREKSIAVAFREIALLVISAAPVTDRRIVFCPASRAALPALRD
jgi:hypothetical protein